MIPIPPKKCKSAFSSHPTPPLGSLPQRKKEKDAPLTLLNNGWLTNALFTTGPSPMLGPYAACAAAMLGGECEMKPMEMKMMRRLSQTALCLCVGR